MVVLLLLLALSDVKFVSQAVQSRLAVFVVELILRFVRVRQTAAAATSTQIAGRLI